MILNVIECVFWGAVAGLVVQSNLKMCISGTLLTSCWISWGVAGGAALIWYGFHDSLFHHGLFACLVANIALL